MSQELDRKIAEKIMGEPEPESLTEDEWGNLYLRDERLEGGELPWNSAYSPKGNWRTVRIYEHGDVPEWQPLPFSTDLEQAMGAVDKWLEDKNLWLRLDYFARLNEWDAYLIEGSGNEVFEVEGIFDTAPEAICRLLLALVEKERM